MFQTKVVFCNVATLCNKTWRFEEDEGYQFSPNAFPSTRNRKKSLDKIDVFLDVESESAIKSRHSHLKFQIFSPIPKGDREAANFCRT